MAALRDRIGERLAAGRSYTAAYRPYVWPVRALADVRLAPFQVLAGSAGTFFARDHLWHMNAAERLAAADPLIVPTRHIVADLGDEGAERRGDRLVGASSPGPVVRAWWSSRSTRSPGCGTGRPAGMKCRGPEYLRIIYGPEYTIPANLSRLAGRNLSRKRSLAASEFALGVEALDRFTRREPLFRVHECVFGVLALESEPVDPRL